MRNHAAHMKPWGQRHAHTVCAWVVFIVVSVVIIVASWGDSWVGSIRPDEARFLSLARNIAEGNWMIMFGQDTDFQKIGYPLFIAPACWIAQGDVWLESCLIRVITVLAFVSSVFPLSRIAAYMTSDAAKRVVVTLAAFFMMPLSLAITSMSETLFTPLACWVFVAAFYVARGCGHDGKRIAAAAGLGVLCYAAYVTREIGISLLLAVAVLIATVRVEYWRDKRGWRSALLRVGAIVAGFAACWLIGKATWFSGMGVSYDQLNFESFGDFNVLIWGLICALPLCIATVVVTGWGVIPALATASLSYSNRRAQGLMLACVTASVVIVVMVCWGITMVEDANVDIYGIRIMSRYFEWLMPFLMMACVLFVLDSRDAQNAPTLRHGPVIVAVCSALFAAALSYGSTSWLLSPTDCMVQMAYGWRVSPHDGQVMVSVTGFLFWLIVTGLLIAACRPQAGSKARGIVCVVVIALNVAFSIIAGVLVVLDENYTDELRDATQSVVDEAVSLAHDGETVYVDMTQIPGGRTNLVAQLIDVSEEPQLTWVWRTDLETDTWVQYCGPASVQMADADGVEIGDSGYMLTFAADADDEMLGEFVSDTGLRDLNADDFACVAGYHEADEATLVLRKLD